MIVVSAVLGAGSFHLEITGHEETVVGDAGRVCSAVSAVSQTCLLGLEQIALQHPELVVTDIKETP